MKLIMLTLTLVFFCMVPNAKANPSQDFNDKNTELSNLCARDNTQCMGTADTQAKRDQCQKEYLACLVRATHGDR